MCIRSYSLSAVPPELSAIGGSEKIGVLGGRVVLAFTVIRAAPPVTSGDIQWLFDTEELINPRAVFAGDRLSVNITNLTLSDEGEYKIEASTAAGIGSATVSLDVQGMA